jgi:phosphatidate cytidylyltransferase
MNPLSFGLGLVLSVLVVATVVVAALRYFLPAYDLQSIWLRIRTWWIIALVLFPALYLGTIGIAAVFTVIGLIAINEYQRLLDPTTNFSWLYTALYGGALIGIFIFFSPIVFLTLFLLSWITLIWHTRTRKHPEFMLTFLFGPIYFATALAAVVALDEAAIFYLLFLTGLNDVLQFLCGKKFGRAKLAPNISPGKTWAGFWGGFIGLGLISSLLAPQFLAVSWMVGMSLGFLIATVGTVGDLTISLLKRRARVADTGRLLPGHGGILDRIDSLCLTGPTFYGVIHLWAFIVK